MTYSTVSSGHFLRSATISSGETVDVLSGGRTDDIKIAPGGIEAVAFGGIAISTLVSGGEQVLFGNADHTTIAVGGSQIVRSGGIANQVAIANGGTETVEAHGLA